MTDSKSVGLIPRVGSSPTTGTSSEIPINAPFPPCGENCALMGISSLSAEIRFAGFSAEKDGDAEAVVWQLLSIIMRLNVIRVSGLRKLSVFQRNTVNKKL